MAAPPAPRLQAGPGTPASGLRPRGARSLFRNCCGCCATPSSPVTRLLLVPKPGSWDPQAPLAQVVLRYTAPGSVSSTTCSTLCSATSTWRASAGGRQSRRWARRSRSGCPSRSNARTRAAAWSLPAATRVQPLIQLNYAADPEDLRRPMAGVRVAWQIAHKPEIARHMHHVALLSEETVGSDDALAAYVRATVSAQFHPCGTAAVAAVHKQVSGLFT